jgi:hypothetical protein
MRGAPRRRCSTAPWLVLLALSGLYLLTRAPSVFPGDPAELVTAAVTLGISHPTGYPLYLLIGKVTTLAMPWFEPAAVMNVLSALLLVVALGVLVDIQLKLEVPPTVVAASIALLGTTPPLWNAATIAEVYTLHVLLLVLVLDIVVRAGDRPQAFVVPMAFGLAGLSLCNHMTSVLLLPGLILWLAWLWHRGGIDRLVTTALVASGSYLAGASALALLFLFDRASAINYIDQYAFQFPAPVFESVVGRIWWLVSGAQYHAAAGILDAVFSPGYLLDLLKTCKALVASNPVLVVVGFIGLVDASHARRASAPQRAVVLVLATTAILNLLYLATYTRYFETVFFGHGYVACAVGLSLLVTHRIQAVVPRSAVAALLVIVAGGTVNRYAVAIDKRGTEFYQRETAALLAHVERNAVIFATWSNSTLFRYELWIRGERPDVRVVNALPANWLRLAGLFRERPLYFESIPPGAPEEYFVPYHDLYQLLPGKHQ